MDITQPQADLDTVVTLAIIELLIQPEYGVAFLEEIARSEGIELTEAQTEHIEVAVNRTLDQLAMPFVESLPEEGLANGRAHYEATLRKRSGYAEDSQEIDLP